MEEAFGIGALIGIDQEIVDSNLLRMGCIARYLFEPDNAKKTVKNEAPSHRWMGPPSITKMVSMQSSNKATQLFMEHALVLGKVTLSEGKDTMTFPDLSLCHCMRSAWNLPSNLQKH